jgi:hypothetical protein
MSGVVIPNKIAAQNIDSLNRSVVCTTQDIENGTVFQLASRSATAGESEVWVATVPGAGDGLKNLWMAASPEVVLTASGTNYYKGLDPDPRNFVNLQDKVFDAFKPQVGDLITLTDDALTGNKGANTHVVATAADFRLNWAGAAIAGLSLKLLDTTYIPLATGDIGTQRLTSYLFEVVAIA